MDFRTVVLIPAYQPTEQFLHFLEQLQEEHLEIVVVNDGSGDSFLPMFRQASNYATILTHNHNRGKGAALKTGIAYINTHISKPFAIVTADADGQHSIPDILHVAQEAEKSPNQLILGGRKFDNHVPLRSRMGNSITRLVYRISSGVKVYDTQTGLRGFTDCLAEKMLTIPGERYEYEMDMLLELAKEKVPIREVTIQTIYIDGNSSSHFDTVKDSVRIYKEILKFSCVSLLSFCVDYILFCLFSKIFGSIVLPNVLARICSGTFNYTLNKKIVFQSDKSLYKSALQYICLATGILICNTLILELFSKIGCPIYLAKIFTEMILFFCNWTIQHFIIFRKEQVAK